MDWSTVIFVTDKRQEALSDFLPGKVQSCKWSDETCLELCKNADCLILPTPLSKLTSREDMTEILKANSMNCKYLFGGKIPPEWVTWCKEHEISCVDFMEDKEIAVKNAQITAEGTIAEILKNSAYSICGQKILVTGYGRCAKALARLLKAMGAKVTILARSKEARIVARKDGYNAVDFSYGPEEMYGAYTIVNTVPACVLTEVMIAEMHKDAIIYDIASLPGGTDLDAAKKYGISVVQAQGLPGKYTTKSSAKILAEAVLRQTLPKRDVREGKSWIFQIII